MTSPSDSLDILDTVLDLLVDAAFSLARWFSAETGLFVGHPEYVLGLAIILLVVAWRL